MRNKEILSRAAQKTAIVLSLLGLLLVRPVEAAGPPPVINAQPLDTAAVYGGTATFTVTASSSTALSYQWYKDGFLILDQLLFGQTRSSLVLSNVSDSDAGKYFVRISNAGGTVTSTKANLTLVAPTYSTITANGTNTSANTISATSLTWAHTVASGNNRVLFVQLAIDGLGASVSSVTYGGVALTQVGRATGNHAVEIWRLVNPAVGTANVVASFGATTAAAGGAATFNGVNQTTPTGTFAGAAGNGKTSSIVVTSTTNDVVIDVVNWAANPAGYTAGAGQTQQWTQTNATQQGVSTTKAGASSVTMSSTVSKSAQWEAGAVSIRAAPNNAPVLDASKSPALTAQDEDSGIPSGAVGTLISNLVDFAVPAGQLDNVTDPDSNVVLGIAVTATDTSNGTWYYSTNGGVDWHALGAVAINNARLLAANAYTRLYFQPNPNYNGTLAGAITFRAWDRTSGGNGTLANTTSSGGNSAFSTATDTASLVINAVNDAPTATNLSAPETYTEDTLLNLTDIVVSDVDNATITATLTLSNPSAGSLNTATSGAVTSTYNTGTGVWTASGASANVNTLLAGLTFTPSLNFNSSFSIYTSVSDGVAAPLTGTKEISSMPVSDPPIATNDNYSTSEDVPLVIAAAGVLTNDTDADGQTLTAALVTNVTQGSLTLSANGAFIYTPPTNYFGFVSFSYVAVDGDHVLLEQNVSGGDDRQISAGSKSSQSFTHGSTNEPGYIISKVVLYLSRRSGGTGNLNFSIGTGVNAGEVAGSSKSISSATITNTSDGSSFQTYTIVYDTPIGPFAAGTTYYLNLDNQASERFYVEYPNNNTYANGTYYEDGANQGKDMRFQIYETVVSNPATVTINVLPVQDPPVAINDSKNASEDVSLTIKVLANDYDPDGTTPTITGVYTTNGTASIANNGTNILFRAATNFYGTVVFNYTISDGYSSATGRVTVVVAPVNDAPVALDDSYNCPENMTLTVPGVGALAAGTRVSGILDNDSDVDGDKFIAWLISDVSHGKLALNDDGSFTYVPEENFVGVDSFTYVACDGPADSAVTTVTINVTPAGGVLKIQSGQMTKNGFELQLSAPAESTCVILASSNNTDWTPISTNYTATGSLVFTDTGAANHPMRFYRAMAR
jgi:hypothetical protein